MCSPKKRKRSTFDDDKSVSPEPDVDAYKKGAELFGGTPAGSPLTLEEDASQVLSAEEENHISTADAATFPSDESPQRKSHRPAPAKQKYTKGKRKGRKALDEDPGTLADRDFGTAIVVEHARSDEAVSSNGEEAEGDEGDEGRDVPEQENAVKTEEGREWLIDVAADCWKMMLTCCYSSPKEDRSRLFELVREELCNASRQVS